MAQYEVKETIPCYVTWTKLVEASSIEEAIQLVADNSEDFPQVREEIGDCLDAYGPQYSATPVG
jgi:hypothetical protein